LPQEFLVELERVLQQLAPLPLHARHVRQAFLADAAEEALDGLVHAVLVGLGAAEVLVGLGAGAVGLDRLPDANARAGQQGAPPRPAGAGAALATRPNFRSR